LGWIFNPDREDDMAKSAFHKWFETFIAEKGIDAERMFEFEDANGFNTMPYGVVIEAVMDCHNPAEQKFIKDTFVKIDFANGDCYHFLRHLGKALAAQRVAA
jgi:hypothetical protein